MALSAPNLKTIFKAKAGIGDSAGELAQLANIEKLGEAVIEWLATAEVIVVDGEVAKPTPPQGGALPVLPLTKIGTIK